MFTGIIEEIGTVKALKVDGNGARIKLAADIVLGDMKSGDSLAVDGVCLTIVTIGHDELEADISRETLHRSTLGIRKAGDKVNLERALTPTSRMGGHIVQGHIDGTGIFQRTSPEGTGYTMSFSPPGSISKFIVEKGSIAINGVSLTIADISSDGFSVAVIPHTLKNTTLRFLHPGNPVNIEADIIGKYIHRFMQKENKGDRDVSLMQKLEQGGFI
jgi:riboflavin synthase